VKKVNLSLVALSLVIMVVLSACGASGSGGSGGDPAASAKGFFDAVISGKGDATTFICTSNATSAAAVKQSLDAMKSSLASSGATLDTSGLTYTAGTVSGDTVTVTIGGSMKVTVASKTTDAPLPSIPIHMKNESGAWKVCG